MLSFAGSDPFKTAMEASLQSIMPTDYAVTLPFSVLPLDDRELGIDGSPWKSADPAIMSLLTDRAAMRRYCRESGLIVPAGVEAMDLEGLARWAMQFRRFPLTLKACRNGSGGRGVYRLEGFRELNTYFDHLREKDGEKGLLRIEEWVEPKAMIELTVGPDDYRMTSQIGREPNLTCRTAWRIYPVNIPASLRPGVETILKAFAAFQPLPKGCLLRFTIALTAKDAVLISLNAGFNRLEYLPDWLTGDKTESTDAALMRLFRQPSAANIPDSIRCMEGASCKTSPGSSSASDQKMRLQFYRRSAKEDAFPVLLPKPAEGLPVKRYASTGRRAVALLAGNDIITLNKSAKLLQTLLATEDSSDLGKDSE
ncbi:MAG: hypothetical protein HQM09_00815 [Candidatus Riflebacteria bacterium]|nr:hypothetical protein [Candidatus Riflebacteria bacterium]